MKNVNKADLRKSRFPKWILAHKNLITNLR